MRPRLRMPRPCPELRRPSVCIPALAQEQVRPRVDEKSDGLILRDTADGCNPAGLPVDVVKPRPLDDPVLEIDADHAQSEKTGDIIRQFAVVLTISPFE